MIAISIAFASLQWTSGGQTIDCAYPLVPPKEVRGQAFLAFPKSSEYTVSSVRGETLPDRKTAYKILRLVSMQSAGSYLMRLEGTSEPVVLHTTKPLLDVWSLDPIVDDEPLQAEISRYPHRMGWVYGGSVIGEGWNPQDENDLQTDFHPVLIKHALRLWRPESVYISVGGSGFGGNLDNFEYQATHPIRILVQPTHVVGKIEGGAFAGPMTQAQIQEEIKRWNNPKTYAIFSLHVADLWDVPRKIAPYPPSHDFQGKDRKLMKRALMKDELVPGLTYRQFAWVMGWPNVRGTPDQVVAMHLDDWEYPSAVMSDHAHFRNGRFVSYEQFNLP